MKKNYYFYICTGNGSRMGIGAAWLRIRSATDEKLKGGIEKYGKKRSKEYQQIVTRLYFVRFDCDIHYMPFRRERFCSGCRPMYSGI